MDDELVVTLALSGSLSYFVLTTALNDYADQLERRATTEPEHAAFLVAEAAEARSLAALIDEQILV
ncbi:hypothetical protein [Microbacterium resistens]|uniref:hypothetical protein n=1 Tax=Microbacterium resistens TaxID=156977 RepID=UPI00082BF99B|nr:hypothetical protein [Microbacterium resistens]